MKRIIFTVILIISVTLCACERNEALSEREFYFCIRGVGFTVGEDAEEIVDRLGNPDRVLCADSCAGEGKDIQYIYGGFKIHAHEGGGKSRITQIEITSDAYATAEGAKIGISRSELVQIYGVGIEENGVIDYVGEECILRFYLINSRVYRIKYLDIDS